MKRWLAFAPLIVLAALAVLFAGYALKRNPQVSPDALVGKTVPALSLPDLDTGTPTPIRVDGDGPMLVNFFASWCAPCEIEHPQLMALKARGVPFAFATGYGDAPDPRYGDAPNLGKPIMIERLSQVLRSLGQA